MDCPAGGQRCTTTISLTIGGGIKEGESYIVNVRAKNRYGESEESGNSDPFFIGTGKNTLCTYSVLVECVCVSLKHDTCMYTLHGQT